MRVVADTNIFVSAALGRSPESPSVRIIDAALDGRIELVMSPALLEEIADVLSRPRIRKRLSADDAQLFLADIAAQVVMLADPPDPPTVCRDPDDDYLVALAMSAGAEVLVSGDDDLLAVKPTRAGVEVVTPSTAGRPARLIRRHRVSIGAELLQVAGLPTPTAAGSGHGDARQTWNRYGHLVPAAKSKPANGLMRS